MSIFAKKPEVVAYKAFAKDNDFKKLKLLARELKVLEFKQGFAHTIRQKKKEAKLEDKINAKTEEIKTLKQSLAEKYDLQTVLAGLAKYMKGPAYSMKVAGEALKILLPATVISAALFILTTAVLQPSLELGLMNYFVKSFLIVAISVGGGMGYAILKMTSRPSHKDVVKMAATPGKTTIDMPM